MPWCGPPPAGRWRWPWPATLKAPRRWRRSAGSWKTAMRSAGDRRTHPAVRTMLAQRLIAIIRTSSPALAITAGRALFAAGLGAVEVALTTPGALTPTEMVHAHQAGADLIKVFPATAWTPP